MNLPLYVCLSLYLVPFSPCLNLLVLSLVLISLSVSFISLSLCVVSLPVCLSVSLLYSLELLPLVSPVSVPLYLALSLTSSVFLVDPQNHDHIHEILSRRIIQVKYVIMSNTPPQTPTVASLSISLSISLSLMSVSESELRNPFSLQLSDIITTRAKIYSIILISFALPNANRAPGKSMNFLAATFSLSTHRLLQNQREAPSHRLDFLTNGQISGSPHRKQEPRSAK